MSHNIRKCTYGHVCPAKIQISLRSHAAWSETLLGTFWISNDAQFFHADNEDYSDFENWLVSKGLSYTGFTVDTFSHVVASIKHWLLTVIVTITEVSLLKISLGYNYW